MLPRTNNSTNEDRDISPLTGVVLLVGLTAVLFAVIRSIVTDTGGEVKVTPTPQVSHDFDTDND